MKYPSPKEPVSVFLAEQDQNQIQQEHSVYYVTLESSQQQTEHAKHVHQITIHPMQDQIDATHVHVD